MSGKSFLPVFDAEYAGRLAIRAQTFRRMFEILEATEKQRYSILETGCARIDDNWWGDGQSTLLFDRFVNFWDGMVRTVDIDQDACNRLRAKVSDKVVITCSDSVRYLHQLSSEGDLDVDLLYLDSFDVDWRNTHPSSLHHVHELCAVMPLLASGTLVMVDDSPRKVAVVSQPEGKVPVYDGGIWGKGGYVAEFFTLLGCEPVLEGYQHGWIMP
jgi:hypothetical protein